MERPDHPDLEPINQFLNKLGEFSPGYPNYRFVWSTDQYENRLGTYRDHTESGVFIRERTEIRRVPKYVLFRNRWVLEKAEAVNNQDLGNTISYEPLWVFHNALGEYLPPSLKAVRFIMWSVLNPGRVITPSDLKDAERAEYEADAEYFVEYLRNEFPDTAVALKEGSAVFISGENK